MNRLNKNRVPTLLAAGAILAVAAAALFTQMSAPKIAHAQTPVPPTTPTIVPPPPAAPTTPKTNIGVSGTGKVSVTPDTAIASIGVEITALTLAEATAEASAKMTAVIDAIKAAGVAAADIQTTNYNVYPITNVPKENETATITAYRVSNIVTVKIRDITQVGTVLDAALEAGANSVNSVYFTVNDPSAAQEEARTAAVKDAMAKAQTLATAAGVQLGSIISISELSGVPIPYANAYGGMMAPQASGAGPVETGSTEITVNVEMHFEIAQ